MKRYTDVIQEASKILHKRFESCIRQKEKLPIPAAFLYYDNNVLCGLLL